MDKNTQQPVAWRVTHIDDQDEQYIAAWDKRRVAHFQASPAAWEMTPLYIAPPAPPVPRGVLMAALEQDAARYRWLRDNLGKTVSHWICTEGGETLDEEIDAKMQK